MYEKKHKKHALSEIIFLFLKSVVALKRALGFMPSPSRGQRTFFPFYAMGQKGHSHAECSGVWVAMLREISVTSSTVAFAFAIAAAVPR